MCGGGVSLSLTLFSKPDCSARVFDEHWSSIDLLIWPFYSPPPAFYLKSLIAVDDYFLTVLVRTLVTGAVLNSA